MWCFWDLNRQCEVFTKSPLAWWALNSDFRLPSNRWLLKSLQDSLESETLLSFVFLSSMTKEPANSLRRIHSRYGICRLSHLEDSSSLEFSSQIATTVRALRSDWPLQPRKAVAFCWGLTASHQVDWKVTHRAEDNVELGSWAWFKWSFPFWGQSALPLLLYFPAVVFVAFVSFCFNNCCQWKTWSNPN